MKKYQKFRHLLSNPHRMLTSIVYRTRCLWPDKIYLKVAFRDQMGYPLDLKNPRTFSEKLQWLKLYNRDPRYTVMVDKVKAKEYVATIIGEEYIIPTLGVWEDPNDIDFGQLPDRFVLKCNHNSGLGMYICKDKSMLDVEIVREELCKGLRQDYFINNREWPYKNVPRRVFAEAYMEDEYGELRDYKWFCFNGKVKALFIATDRSKGDHATRFDFFDENFNHLPFTNGHPNADIMPDKPKMFDKMKELAAKLSMGIPHVRIDFYEVGDKVYFGEMTFFHWSGLMPYDPEEWDEIFGSWINLPVKSQVK